jgi:hypothetical protein
LKIRLFGWQKTKFNYSITNKKPSNQSSIFRKNHQQNPEKFFCLSINHLALKGKKKPIKVPALPDFCLFLNHQKHKSNIQNGGFDLLFSQKTVP